MARKISSSTPTASSVAWRDPPAESVMISSRTRVSVPASSTIMANDSLSKCRY
jgi:hypothetical protein